MEYGYNNSVHSSTGKSPFKVTQGFKGKLIPRLGDLEKVTDRVLKLWWTQVVKNIAIVEKELIKVKEDFKKHAELKSDYLYVFNKCLIGGRKLGGSIWDLMNVSNASTP